MVEWLSAISSQQSEREPRGRKQQATATGLNQQLTTDD